MGAWGHCDPVSGEVKEKSQAKDVGAGSRGMEGFSRRSSGGWGKTSQAEGTVSVRIFVFQRAGQLGVGCAVGSSGNGWERGLGSP